MAALYPATKDAHRVSKYKNIEHDLDFSNLSFPVSLPDVIKFEKKNNISVSVFGATIGSKAGKEYASPYVIQKSAITNNATAHVDLLLLDDKKSQNNHFCWIKNFSRFCGNPTRYNSGGKVHFCRHCLQGYSSNEKLEEHMSYGCQEVTTCKPCMPTGKDAHIQFKNTSMYYHWS
eukprot:SAG31_NODE_10696_length_1108_cov_11.448959_1_plen_175_part_00